MSAPTAFNIWARAVAAARRHELYLPNPKPLERWHDDVDMVARALFPCDVCGARSGSACSWAVARALPSWCSHPHRRGKVNRDFHGRELARWAFLIDL